MHTASTLEIREALARVVDGRNLGADDMAVVVGRIMDGEATPAQIGAPLTTLRMKGETIEEVVGVAQAMRARMVRIPTDATQWWSPPAERAETVRARSTFPPWRRALWRPVG
jgi:anthranilate phosphoribosyltransferase